MTPVGDVERAVLDLLDEDELAAVTRELVRVPGENPPGQEEATALALADLCRERGLDVEVDEVAPGRPNVLASFGDGDAPGLLLLGHTDVVPVGTGWTGEPFSGELRDGSVHGRGSTDMKGGLAACLLAMGAVLEAGVRLPGPVHLAALVDEEDTGLGIRHHVARGLPPLAGCVVAEPTDLRTVVAARGDSYLDYRVGGRAAHSGDPSAGRNAIVGASRVVADLEAWHAELAAARHPLVGPATVSVGTVSGGQGTSIVAAECHLTVDRRLLPEEEPDAVLTQARARLERLGLAADDLTAEVTMTMAMPGFATPADHPWPTLVDGALADAGGPGLPVGGWTAACDGGFVARAGVPVVVMGPGSLDQAHRADERVEVSQLVTAARTYALTVLRFAGR